MVQLARGAVGHDAAHVGLPRRRVDGQRERAAGHHPSAHDGLVLSNVVERADLGAEGTARLVARRHDAVAGHVGVGRLGHDVALRVAEQPGEGVVHEATVAAVVDGVAGHELLLRQGGQGVAREEPLALDATGGREGPAGAALALVLDGGHGTVLAPVLGLARGGLDLLLGHDGGRALDLLRLGVDGLGVVAGLELGLAQVGELVGAELGVGVHQLELARLAHVLSEDLEAASLLGVGRVAAAELALEGLELAHELGGGRRVRHEERREGAHGHSAHVERGVPYSSARHRQASAASHHRHAVKARRSGRHGGPRGGDPTGANTQLTARVGDKKNASSRVEIVRRDQTRDAHARTRGGPAASATTLNRSTARARKHARTHARGAGGGSAYAASRPLFWESHGVFRLEVSVELLITCAPSTPRRAGSLRGVKSCGGDRTRPGRTLESASPGRAVTHGPASRLLLLLLAPTVHTTDERGATGRSGVSEV